MPLKRLSKITLGFLLVLILLIAGLALGLQPLSEKLVRENIPRIEAAAADFLGAPVKIRAIEPHLELFLPSFELHDLAVLEPGGSQPVFSIHRLRLQLDLWQSARAWRAQFGKIELDGLRLVLEQAEDRSWRPRGVVLKPLPKTAASTSLPAWLPSLLQIQLKDLNIKAQPLRSESAELKITASQFKLRLSPVELSTQIQGTGLELASQLLWQRPMKWDQWEVQFSYGLAQGDVEVSKIQFSEKAVQLEGRLAYTAQSGHVDADVRFKKTTLAHLRQLVPISVLPKELRTWLSLAIQGGTTDESRFRLSGRPAEWTSLSAFDGKKNLLELQIPFQGAGLHYLEGWPEITQAAGKFRLENRALGFDLASGQAGEGIKLIKVIGKIDDLSSANPTLGLDTRVQASVEGAKSFLTEGPFKEQAKKALAYVVPAGPVELEVEAAVPLETGAPKGTIDLKGMTLHQPAWNLDFESVKGKVEFSSGQFVFKDLQTLVLGKPLTVSGTHRSGAAGPTETQLKLSLVAPATKLQEVLADMPLKDRFSGDLPIQLDGRIKYGATVEKTVFEVDWKSDLEGLGIQAPAPIGKGAQDKVAASGRAVFRGKTLEELKTKWDRAGMGKLQIELASGKLQKLLSVEGQVQALDAKAWWEFKKAIPAASEKSAGLSLDIDSQLKVGTLSWGDQEIHEADIQAERDTDDWSIRVRSKEVEGKIAYPRHEKVGVLKADFSRILLLKPAEPTEEEQAKLPGEEPDPELEGWGLKDWPSIQFKCDRLERGAEKLGAIRIETRQTGTKMVMERFSWQAPEFEVKLDNLTSNYGTGPESPPMSYIAGEVRLKEYTKTFKPGGTAETAVLNDGKIRIKGKWKGDPGAFRLRNFDAEIVGDVRRGHLTGVKTFALRLVNVLSGNQGDMRKGLLRFTKLGFNHRIHDGKWTVRSLRALLGSVYFGMTGDSDLRTTALDLETKTVAGVGDIPDSRDELDGIEVKANWEEPKSLLSVTKKITGTWKDPKVE